MNDDKKICKEVMSHICDSLGEDLDSPKCIAIKNHLDECPDCSNYFKSVEKTIDFYKKYNVDLPVEVHSRLINFLGLDEKE